MDIPLVLNALDTPIAGNTGAFTRVVASLPSDVKRIVITDNLNEHIGIYRGAPGQEVEVGAIAGGGTYEKDITLFKGDTVWIRGLESNDITRGSLLLEFYAER